ncbi:MAG: hypothetical protein ACREQI_07685 [Candidatus Binataceae bacterium]
MRTFPRLPVIVSIASALMLGLGAGNATATNIKSCATKTFKAKTPGATYKLTAGQTVAAATDCIHVTAPGVTIDLAGFTITGHNGKANGIVIMPKAVGASIVSSTSGGTITGFDTGILDQASSARIEGLSITNNTTAGVVVSGPPSVSGTPPIIDGSVIAGNLITGNGQYGVELASTTHCMVDRNSQIGGSYGIVSGNTDIGVWIANASGAQLTADNVVSWNELIEIGGSRIEAGASANPASCSGSASAATLGNIIANNSLPLDADNSQYGIALQCNSAEDTAVLANDVPFGAGAIDDLFDGNTSPPCGSNFWGANTFGTSNQSCIH